MDLPVTKYTIEDFAEVWADYDPNATGFIPIAKLEKLLEDLAKKCDKLFYTNILRDRIGNKNVNEDMTDIQLEKILKRNNIARVNYLIALDIPTYGDF